VKSCHDLEHSPCLLADRPKKGASDPEGESLSTALCMASFLLQKRGDFGPS
jgi:hypothetical protein